MRLGASHAPRLRRNGGDEPADLSQRFRQYRQIGKNWRSVKSLRTAIRTLALIRA
ncbi:hypothetical protein KCP74_22995 [Salmonella enterica subsp. enterica]|nr:hypothetical protein KCP74_22995 [Salmonella enterica subsp. enterica]